MTWRVTFQHRRRRRRCLVVVREATDGDAHLAARRLLLSRARGERDAAEEWLLVTTEYWDDASPMGPPPEAPRIIFKDAP